jgi:O-antigen/teichoic acid export membrane protein
VAFASFTVLASAGSWYVERITRDAPIARTDVWVSWAVFVVALILNVYFQWQSALLIGADRVQQNYRINIVSRVVQFALSVGGLLVAPTITVLAIGYVASVAVTRVYGYFSIRDLLGGTKEPRRAEPRHELFPILWHSASRLGLVSLGAFLITRYGTFAIGYFLGLPVAARFAIAMQALGVIQALSQVAFSLNMPRISAGRVVDDRATLRRLVLRSLTFAWIVFVGLSLAMIVVGPSLLAVMHSRTTLPSTSILVLMSIVMLLESNHSNCALVIVSGNTVPFVPAALLSGVAIVVGTTLAGWLGGGLVAFVLVQGFVQLAYNNWKWPLLVFRDLGIAPGLFGKLGG